MTLSPLNRRRLANFRANRRGWWSLWVFAALFVVTLFAEFIANDRPILVSYKGEWLTPVFVDYPEEKFGGFLARTDFRDPVIAKEIAENGYNLSVSSYVEQEDTREEVDIVEDGDGTGRA